MPRLFTGLELPETLAADLAMMRGGLNGARWIDVENYHITLRFIGDIDDRSAHEVHDALDRIRRPAFKVTIAGLSAFGGDKPRAIVASAKPTQPLLDLQAEQERLMRRIGIPAESRKYAPHVTLARLRQTSSLAVADYLALRGWMSAREFEVDHFTLFSSRDSVGGGPYVAEASIPYIECPMHRLIPILLLLATGSAVAGTAASSKSFGGWTVACNNLGACVVLGSSEDDQLFYLRLSRDAGADAAPKLKIVVVTQDKIKGDAKSFRLTTNDKGQGNDTGKATPLPPIAGGIARDDDQEAVANVPAGEPTLMVLEAIRNAATLDYAIGGLKGTLDLKGLSAALRYMDARQGRAGTPTALVARGMTPVGQVPAPATAPLVTPAPSGSLKEIAKPAISAALLAAATAICDPDVIKAHDGAQAWSVGPGRVLMALPCSQGAYNFASALYLTDARGGAPKPVDLPQPTTTDDSAPNVIVNMEFDPKTMALSMFNKGRGIADCGETATWIWTGKAFALLEAADLDACPGALSDDWPNIYKAVKR